MNSNELRNIINKQFNFQNYNCKIESSFFPGLKTKEDIYNCFEKLERSINFLETRTFKLDKSNIEDLKIEYTKSKKAISKIVNFRGKKDELGNFKEEEIFELCNKLEQQGERIKDLIMIEMCQD